MTPFPDSRLRILVACIPTPGTRFLEDWKSGIASSCDVIHDHLLFWDGEGDFDVVHIHWPEYLSFEIEKSLGRRLEEGVIPRLSERLRHWRGRSARIVVHRHNVFPHQYRDPAFETLYETVYAHADAVVHMGETSKREYLARYAGCFPCDRQIQSVIPHANFASYPNAVSKEAARRELGIRPTRRTVLIFGGLGRREEADMALRAFYRLPGRDKMLLVPNWRETPRRIAWIRLKYWVRDLTRWYYRLHPWFNFGYGFVADERVQYYLNAADVLMVPRWRPLNSGNLILGFTFGKVVVGPDSGNVGEILRSTGNPTFDPGNIASVVDALGRGLQLAKQGLGDANRRLALERWTVQRAGEMQVNLYHTIPGGSREGNNG